MKKTLVVALLLSLLIPGLSFAEAEEDALPIAWEVFDGGSFVVFTLEGNPTTGYAWTYTVEPEGLIEEMTPEELAEYIEPTETEPPEEDDELLVGEGQPTVIALAPTMATDAYGDVTVTFTYARAWEPDSAVSYLVSLWVVENGTIDVLSVEEIPADPAE